jgi:hypothetical protein
VSRFIGRYTDRKNTSIDVDNIDSVELRQAFYAATDDALDALKLPRRSQKDYD